MNKPVPASPARRRTNQDTVCVCTHSKGIHRKDKSCMSGVCKCVEFNPAPDAPACPAQTCWAACDVPIESCGKTGWLHVGASDDEFDHEAHPVGKESNDVSASPSQISDEQAELYPQAVLCTCKHPLMNHCLDGCVMCFCTKFSRLEPVAQISDEPISPTQPITVTCPICQAAVGAPCIRAGMNLAPWVGEMHVDRVHAARSRLEPAEAPELRDKIDANLKSGLDWRGRTPEEVASHHAETDLQREPVEAVSTTPTRGDELGRGATYCPGALDCLGCDICDPKVSTPLPQQLCPDCDDPIAWHITNIDGSVMVHCEDGRIYTCKNRFTDLCGCGHPMHDGNICQQPLGQAICGCVYRSFLAKKCCMKGCDRVGVPSVGFDFFACEECCEELNNLIQEECQKHKCSYPTMKGKHCACWPKGGHCCACGITIPDLPQPDGIALIRQERLRQIESEEWTAEHDDLHSLGEMALAAKTYILAAQDSICGRKRAVYPGWPWDYSWWKPSDDPIRNLVKAGALIAAEIDRLQRSQK